MTAMGGHQSPRALSCVWLTPPALLRALGPFDLDPCACSEPRPWPTAANHYAAEDDGLSRDWEGRVWLNPPYGPPGVIGPWMRRMARHDFGTALIFARTETVMFAETVWRAAAGCLFLAGRLHFHRPDGLRARANAGAPSVLVAYGSDDLDRLASAGLEGQLVPLRLPRSVLIAMPEPSWRRVVSDLLDRSDGPVSVAELFAALRGHPKLRGRRHAREKVRQTLQRGAGRRVGRDAWVAA